MKKTLLLIITLSLTFAGYTQLSEDFESGTFPPTGWTTFRGTNGEGPNEDWKEQDFPTGNKGAVCVWEDFPGVNVIRSEDWLVTAQFTVDAANTMLSFDNVDSASTDYGSIYTVRVSTASQTTHADFTIVDTQNETQIFHSQTALAGNTHTVDLSAYAGQAIYLAFVMEQDDGDLWRLDNINMISPITCPEPTNIVVSNQTMTGAQVDWTAGGTETAWDVEYGPVGFTQGTGTAVSVTTTPTTTIPGLSEATGYDFYIQANCGTADGTSMFPDVETFYTIAAPYNVNAGYNNPSNGVENGSSCDADNTTSARTVAHDIIVPANTTLSLTKLVPHVLMLPGVTATTVNVTIYDNNAGLPGAVVSNQPTVVPTSSKTSGTNFGFVVNELELDLTPVDLANTTGANLSYWIGISVSKSDGAGVSNAFWENTTVSLVGSGQAYDDGAAGFVADATVDGVYSFVASASTSSIEDDILASNVSIYPSTVGSEFTIKNNSNIVLTRASIYDVNGRLVLQDNLNNLIGLKTINVSNLSSGLYFVEVQSTDGKLIKKIIKK
ncbi:MAG: choice-of-anchor J domain-containing protein [Flavobacteriaceae bacterium]